MLLLSSADSTSSLFTSGAFRSPLREPPRFALSQAAKRGRKEGSQGETVNTEIDGEAGWWLGIVAPRGLKGWVWGKNGKEYKRQLLGLNGRREVNGVAREIAVTWIGRDWDGQS